jgi:EF-P beta-lysylation protein EpmB
MITSHPLARHPTAVPTWQQELAAAITDAGELLRCLDLDPAQWPEAASPEARAAAGQFPLRVPASYLRRMRRGDPHDPLLRQVLPLGAEARPVPGFGGDPLGEAQARRAPSLLQKYAGRALVLTTGACAVHCRYCFRREYDYTADASLDGALAAIAADAAIEEVILSGGDPLVLGNRRLGDLLNRLATMPHVRRVRLHTRTPIVLPSRIDAGLLAALATGPAAKVVVLHANHAQEIDAEMRTALQPLRDAGVTLLNQSVLLAGVNDSVPVLAKLSTALFEAGVLPYYLHLLDRVNGVAHFDVPEERARMLMHGLLAGLPGYLVPRLVREEPGAPSKSWLDLHGSPASVPGLTPDVGAPR